MNFGLRVMGDTRHRATTAIAFVNSGKGSQPTAGETASITYSPTAGNAVLAMIALGSSVTALTCVDNNSNALTSGGSGLSWLCYGFAKSGATSYTYNWTTANSKAVMLIVEYSHVGGFGTLLANSGSNASNPNVSPIAPSVNNVIIGLLSCAVVNITFTSIGDGSIVTQNAVTGIPASSSAVQYPPTLPSTLTAGPYLLEVSPSTAESWAARGIALLP
jgi:hypothetical protein